MTWAALIFPEKPCCLKNKKRLACLTSDKPFPNFRPELPKQFMETSSSPKSVAKGLWNIDKLEIHDKGEIFIKGRIDLTDGSEFSVKSKLFTNSFGDETVLAEEIIPIKLETVKENTISITAAEITAILGISVLNAIATVIDININPISKTRSKDL